MTENDHLPNEPVLRPRPYLKRLRTALVALLVVLLFMEATGLME